MTGPVNHAESHPEHPTPRSIVEAAREVMGRIDLDPASTKEFNRVVKAAKFYTKEQDGFAQDWEWMKPDIGTQTIFLNPPGSRSPNGGPSGPSCHEWLDKLHHTIKDSSDLEQAIYIGYNGPETLSRRPWICRQASAILWTSVEGTAAPDEGFVKCSGRVKFMGDRPYFPSLILYWGWNVVGFYEHFRKFGTFIEVLK